MGGQYRMNQGDWVAGACCRCCTATRTCGPIPTGSIPTGSPQARPKTRPPHAYKPFGTGQRACIGRQFALHEAVLALGLILHRYHLTPPNDYRLQIAESLTLKPQGFELVPRRRR